MKASTEGIKSAQLVQNKLKSAQTKIFARRIKIKTSLLHYIISIDIFKIKQNKVFDLNEHNVADMKRQKSKTIKTVAYSKQLSANEHLVVYAPVKAPQTMKIHHNQPCLEQPNNYTRNELCSFFQFKQRSRMSDFNTFPPHCNLGSNVRILQNIENLLQNIADSLRSNNLITSTCHETACSYLVKRTNQKQIMIE